MNIRLAFALVLCSMASAAVSTCAQQPDAAVAAFAPLCIPSNVVKRLRIWWTRWRLQAAEEDLDEHQACSEVGPFYLCNLLQHRTELEWRLQALSK